MTTRFQVRDAHQRKINLIEWDGLSELSFNHLGWTITPDDGTPVWMAPPTVVTRRQLILALSDQDKLTTVNAIVMTADLTVRLSWEATTEFHRTDPLLTLMAEAHGWSDDDLDDLFRLAATR